MGLAYPPTCCNPCPSPPPQLWAIVRRASPQLYEVGLDEATAASTMRMQLEPLQAWLAKYVPPADTQVGSAGAGGEVELGPNCRQGEFLGLVFCVHKVWGSM